mgnify:FL=1
MRLIDADALFEAIEKSMAENPHKEKTQRAMHIHEHKHFLTLLTSFPTIQPVATDTNVDDIISRQAAIDGKISIQCANGVEIYSDEAVPVEYLKALPSAQPGKTGRWIGKYPFTSACSECNYFIHASKVKVFAYCPNCEADMRKENK